MSAHVTVQTGHGAVAALDFGGDGVPVVLLHGGTRTLADWGAVIPLLAGDFRVIAVDFHGHGRSEDRGMFHWRDAAGDVTAVVDSLGLVRPIVAGHSLGGMVACVYATTDGRARGVVNVDGHGSGLADQLDGLSPMSAVVALDRAREESVAELGGVPDLLTDAELAAEVEGVLALAAAAQLDSDYSRDLVMRGYRQLTDGTHRRSPSAAVNVAMYRSLADLDMQPFYLGLPCPAVILRTANDEVAEEHLRVLVEAFDRGLSRQLAEVSSARPDIAVEQVPGGHMIPLEQPEWLARRIQSFAATLTTS